MKKSTLIIWAIICGILALLIFGNREFFLARQTLHVNLGVVDYLLPEMSNATLFLIFFFAGLVIAYLFGLSARFRARSTIKKLNATIAQHNKQLSELKKEIEVLKGDQSPSAAGAPAAGSDLPASQGKAEKNPEGRSAASGENASGTQNGQALSSADKKN